MAVGIRKTEGRLFGQTPSWAWAKNTGSTSSNWGNCVTTDAQGNVYVTGLFQTPSITLGAQTFTNHGQADIFVVKYDSNGNVLWAKSAGGGDWDVGNAITTDAFGNVYLTGSFSSSGIAFGSYILSNTGTGFPTLNYDSDFFIVKFDTDGNVLWAKNPINYNNSSGHSLVADQQGNIYVTGIFGSSSIKFDNVILNNVANFGYDPFILKYNPSGTALWAKRTGSKEYVTSTKIVLDRNSNLYVTGTFFDSTIIWGNDTLTNEGSLDFFILKCTTSGNELWGKRWGGIEDEEAAGISVDNGGNIFATGIFTSSQIIFDNDTLVNTDHGNIYVVKLDSSGNTTWAKCFGETGGVTVGEIVNDANGNAYVTGSFIGDTIIFDNYILQNANSGTQDFFITSLSGLNGNTIWTKSVGGTGEDVAFSACTDLSGNIYLTGGYGSSYLIFGNDTLINTSNYDMFVAKIGSTTIGITDKYENDMLKLYPNPTSGLTYISVPNSTKQIQLYNSTGQLLQTKTTNGQTQLVFEIENDGLYFVTVTDDSRSITKKVVVCR